MPQLFYLLLLLWLGAGTLRAEIVLRVQGLPNDASTDAAALAEQRVVAAFQQRHPGVRLVPAEGLRVQGLNTEAATIMMISGGIAPDVIRMQFRSSDSYIRQGLVASLNPYLAGEPEGGKAILGEIEPQILPVIQRRAESGEPQVYGLPTQPVWMGLYFNRELFRRAGLPPRAPRDWEELLAFARKLKTLGKVHPLFLPSGTGTGFGLMNFIRAAGGDALHERAPDEWVAVFDSPEAEEGYLMYYQLIEGERLAYRLARNLTPEEMETTGMLFRYVGDTAAIDPDLWGFGAVPKGPRGHRGSEINAGILAMYAGITEEAKRHAAWEYIRYVTSEEADRVRINALVELGQGAIVNPAALRKFGHEDVLVMTPPGFEAEFAEAMADCRPEPYGRNCNLIYMEVAYPMDEILLSEPARRAWEAGDTAALRNEIRAILSKAAERTNERMIGHVPPEEMAHRRRVAAALVAAIAIAFIFVGRSLIAHFSKAGAGLAPPVGKKPMAAWLCLLPAGASVLLWNYLPMVRGTQMAFLDYRILLKSSFVGLDNFANVLFDPSFWNSLLATAHFAAWMLTIGFFLPMLLAYALHLIPKHKIFYRTVYYLPAVISGTAVFFLWKGLFDADGLLNQILQLTGFDNPRAWTEEPRLAMLACVIPGIWAGAGPGCLIYLAALKSIPPEQFEASEIDGAGFLSKTRHIVYPGIKGLIIINFIGALVAAFHGATNILIMTGGGPNGATEVASLLIFFEAFSRLRFGPATAMAWIIGSMLLGLTVMQLKRISRMEFRTAR